MFSNWLIFGLFPRLAEPWSIADGLTIFPRLTDRSRIGIRFALDWRQNELSDWSWIEGCRRLIDIELEYWSI